MALQIEVIKWKDKTGRIIFFDDLKNHVALEHIDFWENLYGEMIFEYCGDVDLEQLIKMVSEEYKMLLLFHLDELRKM